MYRDIVISLLLLLLYNYIYIILIIIIYIRIDSYLDPGQQVARRRPQRVAPQR